VPVVPFVLVVPLGSVVSDIVCVVVRSSVLVVPAVTVDGEAGAVVSLPAALVVIVPDGPPLQPASNIQTTSTAMPIRSGRQRTATIPLLGTGRV
jgi:hypothetical protein